MGKRGKLRRVSEGGTVFNRREAGGGNSFLESASFEGAVAAKSP